VKREAKAGKRKGNIQALAKAGIPQGRETEENMIMGSGSNQPSQTAVNKKEEPISGAKVFHCFPSLYYDDFVYLL
jgi:hypothetical protein